MNRLILVLLLFIFSIAAFAADETISFSANVSTGCTLSSPTNGILALDTGQTLLSNHPSGQSGAVLLECPTSAHISISTPSVFSSNPTNPSDPGLTDAGNSNCSFAGTFDGNLIGGDSNNDTTTLGSVSVPLSINVFWNNSGNISDGSYVINCTITALPL